MRQSAIRTPLLALAMTGLALAGAGCKTEGGRVDISETTSSEKDSGDILPIAYVEFSDEAAQQLIQDLSHIDEIRDAPEPVTILIGDINNKTGRIPSSEFEMVASRLRNNLIRSRIARNEMKFVERRARMERIAERERVGSVEVPAGPDDYDPATTFSLNTDAYLVSRGDTKQYYLEFTLSHFASNVIVDSFRYEMKQQKPQRDWTPW